MRYVVDIETTSTCDLAACGAYNYAMHPSTEILCIAWADADVPSAEPELWRCDNGEPIDIALEILLSAELLIAHNAMFERRCLSAVHPGFRRAELWADSAMLSGAAGRPHALRDACRSLCLPESLEKDARGKRLLNMFSIQSSKLYVGGPDADKKAFNELCEYCRQDVRAERAVWNALAARFYTPLLQRQWIMDCSIDDNGIPVDTYEISGAKSIYEYMQEEAECTAAELTGGIPLRSTVGLRKWTAAKGWPLDSFSRSAVDEALADEVMCDAHPEVAELLRLRKTVAGTAGKKFDAFLNTVCVDGRVRGALQARVAHTGRYAGRGIQPQNLPRGFVSPMLLEYTRQAAYMASDIANDLPNAVAMMHLLADGQECDALASLCRDSIAAPPGRMFVVADYSAVEARVLAWLASEKWVEDIFAGDGKIYERTAAAMYHKRPEDIDKHERMAGKIATLALGYGGGVGALQRFAAAYGVHWTDTEAQTIVDSWRGSRTKTKALWKMLDDGFRAVATGARRQVNMAVGKSAYCSYKSTTIAGRPVVICDLPSGRQMVYWAPKIDPENGEIAVETYGSANCSMDSVAVGAGMSRVYGGLLAENLTQAVAFDLLLVSLLKLHAAGRKIIMHIHDEIVVECAENEAKDVAKQMAEIMGTAPSWGSGLRLIAEPEIMPRYKK